MTRHYLVAHPKRRVKGFGWRRDILNVCLWVFDRTKLGALTRKAKGPKKEARSCPNYHFPASMAVSFRECVFFVILRMFAFLRTWLN